MLHEIARHDQMAGGNTTLLQSKRSRSITALYLELSVQCFSAEAGMGRIVFAARQLRPVRKQFLPLISTGQVGRALRTPWKPD